MAKKKKTLKQKIAADMRHQNHITSLPDTLSQPVLAGPIPDISTKTTIKTTITTSQYSFLYKDLSKTLFLTILIIAVELIIKNFFIGSH